MENQYEDLKTYISKLGRVAVAFSGGVDSAFLLYAAKEALGENALAITVDSAVVSAKEKDEAKAFCDKHGIRQIVAELDVFDIKGFKENPMDRCYICKRYMFKNIKKLAAEEGIENVLEGTNRDDSKDYRPGAKAIAELKIISPLEELGFTKKEIRACSAELDLETAAKPALACLATRIPYGEEINRDKLLMIEKAEEYLSEKGFSGFRVRHHGDIARIETAPEDLEKMIKEDARNKIYEGLKKLGFVYVALDLKGYRTGSMNENSLTD